MEGRHFKTKKRIYYSDYAAKNHETAGDVKVTEALETVSDSKVPLFIEAINNYKFSLNFTVAKKIDLQLSILFCCEQILNLSDQPSIKQQYAQLVFETVTEGDLCSKVTNLFDLFDINYTLFKASVILDWDSEANFAAQKLISLYPLLEELHPRVLEEESSTYVNYDKNYIQTYKKDYEIAYNYVKLKTPSKKREIQAINTVEQSNEVTEDFMQSYERAPKRSKKKMNSKGMRSNSYDVIQQSLSSNESNQKKSRIVKNRRQATLPNLKPGLQLPESSQELSSTQQEKIKQIFLKRKRVDEQEEAELEKSNVRKKAKTNEEQSRQISRPDFLLIKDSLLYAPALKRLITLIECGQKDISDDVREIVQMQWNKFKSSQLQFSVVKKNDTAKSPNPKLKQVSSTKCSAQLEKINEIFLDAYRFYKKDNYREALMKFTNAFLEYKALIVIDKNHKEIYQHNIILIAYYIEYLMQLLIEKTRIEKSALSHEAVDAVTNLLIEDFRYITQNEFKLKHEGTKYNQSTYKDFKYMQEVERSFYSKKKLFTVPETNFRPEKNWAKIHIKKPKLLTNNISDLHVAINANIIADLSVSVFKSLIRNMLDLIDHPERYPNSNQEFETHFAEIFEKISTSGKKNKYLNSSKLKQTDHVSSNTDTLFAQKKNEARNQYHSVKPRRIKN